MTFLVPGFGMVWGSLLLDEKTTLPMLMGCTLIIAGTAGIPGLLRKKPVTSA